MKTASQWRADLSVHLRDYEVVVPGLAALFAGILTLWATASHMVLKYDSIFYLGTAENLARWEWMVDYNGDPMTNFPPGLPLLYRVVMLLGLDSLPAARLVGVASSVLIVVLSAYIAHRVGPRGSASVTAVTVSVLPAMIVMNTQVMSEPAFTVAVLAVIVALVRLPAAPAIPTWRNLLPLIVASWLSGLIRYQGYAVLAAVALVLFTRPHPWLQRFKVAAMYSATAGLVVLFNVLQSSSRAESFGAPMLDARGSTARDVEVALSSVGEWLTLDNEILDSVTTETLGAGVIVLVAASIAYSIWWMRKNNRSSLMTAVLIVFASLPLLTFAAARRVWVEMTPRMIFSFFPLAVIVVSIAAVAVASKLPRSGQAIIATLAVTLFLFAGDQTITAADRIRSFPSGLNGDAQQVPELGRAVADLDPSAIVYAGNSEGIWLSSGGRRILEFDPWINDVEEFALDDPESPPPREYEDRLWTFSRHLCDGFYLADTDWRHSRRPSASLRKVSKVAVVETVREFDGGRLYFLTSSVPDLCTRVEQHFADSKYAPEANRLVP